MAATEENFKDYKQVEKKALELLAEMRRAAGGAGAAGGQKVDIELALLVAIFELHKGELPPQTVGSIVQGHLKQIIPYYSARAAAAAAPTAPTPPPR